jgi:hypothetical protein
MIQAIKRRTELCDCVYAATIRQKGRRACAGAYMERGRRFGAPRETRRRSDAWAGNIIPHFMSILLTYFVSTQRYTVGLYRAGSMPRLPELGSCACPLWVPIAKKIKTFI